MTSAHDMQIASTAAPEILALAEVLKIAVPGLKMPHVTLAATMGRMLLKRGVRLVTEPTWRCKAPSTADPPQDCDWPMCGCDPYADKVLASLEEAGIQLVCAQPSEPR